MDAKCSWPGFLAGMLFVLALPSTPAQAQSVAISKWREDFAAAQASLEQGKWKAAKRKADKLATEIGHEAWYERDLEKLLANVAMMQAVTRANLGKTEEAIWYWLVAQNVDRRIRETNLETYGSAAKLLREFPLRPLGKAPPNVHLVEQIAGQFRGARPPKKWAPELLYNAAIASEKPSSVYVEFLVDRRGRARHPVIQSVDVHPVLVYGILVALYDLPAFEPASLRGDPVDSLFDLGVPLRMSRWNQGGQAFVGEVQ
ncbi:MAG: hypothetical protein AAF560_29635 [Acidobacteriota bacterium]